MASFESRRYAFAIGLFGLLAIGLQACREDEQNRPLSFDKGTYIGAPDTALSPEEVDALVQRTAGPQI